MLLSVIIPVYNVADTLERAILSVLKQRITDFELILVNDGATDNSGDICDHFAELDERVRVIHKENGGLSSARNAGIDVAKGEFLAFLDSDDYFEEQLFATFEHALEQHPDLDLFRFNVTRVNNGAMAPQPSINRVSSDVTDNLATMFDYRGIDFYAWNKIYHNKLFIGVRYPEGKLYEDIMTTYEATKRATKVVTTDENGIFYIANETSIVASDFNPKQYDNVTERIKLSEEINKDFPSLRTRALEKVADGFLSTGYKIANSKKTPETMKFYDILKNDIKFYFPQLQGTEKVPKVKLLALRLLVMNLKIYGWLYKKYLRK